MVPKTPSGSQSLGSHSRPPGLHHTLQTKTNFWGARRVTIKAAPEVQALLTQHHVTLGYYMGRVVITKLQFQEHFTPRSPIALNRDRREVGVE